MDLVDKIKIYFYDRAPNSILEDNIYLEFSDSDESEIETALSELESAGFLISKEQTNQVYPALCRKAYRIEPDTLGDYPIETEIEAAGIKVPRLIDGDMARSEDVNNLIHSINKIIDAKVNYFEKQLDAQNRRFWATLITILGIFISLFSIINIGVKVLALEVNTKLAAMDITINGLLNIVPLSIVLLLFLWLLNKIMNNNIT